MKRIFTFLLPAIISFTGKTTAQTACNLVAGFKFSTDTVNRTVHFFNGSSPLTEIDSTTWFFGDGSSSNDINPTHTYANYGAYNICLRIKKNTVTGVAPCLNYSCHIDTIPAPSTTCTLVAYFSWLAEQTQPNKINFTNQSVPFATGDSIRWTFGDGSSSFDINPSHIYGTAGTYNVCIRVAKLNTAGTAHCVKEFCKTITICNLVAGFKFSTDTVNRTVHFFNESTPLTGIDSTTWFFGDGSSSNDINPTHTYANYGAYNICLRIKKNTVTGATPCLNYSCHIDTIPAPSTNCNLVAGFKFSTDTVNRTVHFFNGSSPLTGIDSTTWFFGDGSSSNDINPTHTYANYGAYNICLRIKKNTVTGVAPCLNYSCHIDTIPAPSTACTLVAYFSWLAEQTQPNKINFTNQSASFATGDSIRWTFGDGSSSFDINPSHIYATAGTYNVCIRVAKLNTAGTAHCVKEFCKTITIQLPVPCDLTADFNWKTDSMHLNNIYFLNQSNPFATGDSIRWTFGDGSSSNDINPSHIYMAAGTYSVCIRVAKLNTANTSRCVKEICKTITIQPASCNLIADFDWKADPGQLNKFNFINLSNPFATGDSIRWSFGDGSYSTDNSPSHTYNTPGTYSVCIRVAKLNTATTGHCVREICKTITIQSSSCDLIADFNWKTDSMHLNNIYFINQSNPFATGDSIRWTFGDGSSSNDINPSHLYTSPGTYSVCIRVAKLNTANTSHCVKEICKTIIVQQSTACDLKPYYSWKTDSVNNKKIYFTNSTNINISAGIVWDFGDGITATSWNAVHEYVQPGRYYVCLRIKLNENCIKYYCDSITVHDIQVADCKQLSLFSFVHAPTDNQWLTFTPVYQNTNVEYTWTFGDGTGSHNIISNHRYTQPGVYTACLTAYREPGCATTTCKEVTVAATHDCDSFYTVYQYQKDAAIPNKIYFYELGNFSPIAESWTITTLTNTTGIPVALNVHNPVYLFNDTGYYKVCLRTTTPSGCVEEYCNTIHIETITNNCQLQAYPNPANTQVSLNLQLAQPEMIHVFIYNVQNVLVKQQDQQGSTGVNVVTVNTESLAAGVYVIKLIYGSSNCSAKFQKL